MEIPDLTPEADESAAGDPDEAPQGFEDDADEAAVEESAREHLL